MLHSMVCVGDNSDMPCIYYSLFYLPYYKQEQ